MKCEDWQGVYAPHGDALDMRVQQALGKLPQERRAVHVRRRWAVLLAAVLALASAIALAAGLLLSDRMDARTAAWQALAAQYGFTPEMEAFFDCEVSPDGRTVVFSPRGMEQIAQRLGVYTVTLSGGDAQASWSHDGEKIGEALTSPIWDAALLGQALSRKASGEDWTEILLPEQMLAVSITQEQAVSIARQTAEAELGADALAAYPQAEAHLYYEDVQIAERDGHSVRRWEVWFYHEERFEEEWITVRLYADDGEVFDCARHTREEQAQIETQDAALIRQADARSAEAQARAEITRAQAVELARDALAQVYGLTQAQLDELEWQEDYAPSPYRMEGDAPIITEYFWLWQGDGEAFTEGNGLYAVEVNAQTGVIEEVRYDSGLNGNG